MEPIFENVTVPTQALYTSLFRNIYKKGIRKDIIVFTLFCAGAACLAWQYEQYAYLVAVPFFIYYLIRSVRFPVTNGERTYLRRLNYYDNSMPPITYRFYEEYIASFDVDSFNQIPYRKLSQVDYLPDIVILTCKNNHTYCLDTNAFTKGDYESFTRFLQEKTPHLNPAQKQ